MSTPKYRIVGTVLVQDSEYPGTLVGSYYTSTKYVIYATDRANATAILADAIRNRVPASVKMTGESL